MKYFFSQIYSNIISLLDIGLSSRKIVAKLKVGHSTMDRVHKSTCPNAQISKGGRLIKLTANDKRYLARMITSSKANTATQLAKHIKNDSSMEVSANIVQWALKEVSLKATSKQKKPATFIEISASIITISYHYYF